MIESTSYWWLSFADPNLPMGKQFLGVVIIQAPDFLTAWRLSHEYLQNPGGEVAGDEMDFDVPPHFLNRLLTMAEALLLQTTVD